MLESTSPSNLESFRRLSSLFYWAEPWRPGEMVGNLEETWGRVLENKLGTENWISKIHAEHVFAWVHRTTLPNHMSTHYYTFGACANAGFAAWSRFNPHFRDFMSYLNNHFHSWCGSGAHGTALLYIFGKFLFALIWFWTDPKLMSQTQPWETSWKKTQERFVSFFCTKQ